jgi:RNA polymerase sigma factor (sigma-70 family)
MTPSLIHSNRAVERTMFRDEMMRAPVKFNPLVEDHVGFARALARRLGGLLPGHADREALESDAMYGLLLAARSFDPARGATFATYASRRIHGAMLDGLRERRGCGRNHHPPMVVSLSQPVGAGDGHDAHLGDLLCGDDEPVGTHLEREDHLERLLGRLRASERRLVREYYFDDLTLSQIGRRHGISASRVSQCLKDARQRMREVGCVN